MIGCSNNSKKRKIPPSAKYFGLQSFLQPGCPISPTGPFRDNVRFFLQDCCQLEGYNVEGMPIWCTFLFHENRGFVLPLYTIEECIKNSSQPLCDHCRCSGWSHHLVSKRKYHFIIPIDNEWNKPVESGVLELQTHILHGLIHCNGFGHLLCINGIEGGSSFVYGREVMDLWDRICTTLHSREISLVDSSKKRDMDLRVLYGVSYGHSWFGRWGYKFGHGSFGITRDEYEVAVETLSSLELDNIIHDKNQRSIKKLIGKYRGISDTRLVTVRDLFRFMLNLKFQRVQMKKDVVLDAKPRMNLVNKKGCRKFSNLVAKLDSRWPVKRLEEVAKVVVNALKENENSGMSRQEVRDTARLHVGDTGLIDYVLKLMNNVIVGGCVVRRAVNKETGVLEFSLEEAGQNDEPLINQVDFCVVSGYTGNDVYKDLGYLYQDVLMDSDSETVERAARTLLDSRNFTKKWPFNDDNDELLRFLCRVFPLATTESRRNSIGEVVVVPLYATIRELKMASEHAMRDTYCAMENLKVREIVELEGLDEEEVICGTIESGSEISVRGFGVDLSSGSDLNYEGGADNWVVSCKCGARDDDGERMVACDLCEIWQHTRCNGIDDGDEVVPPLFMCHRCCDSVGAYKNKKKQVESMGFVDWMMVPLVTELPIEFLTG